MRWHPRLWGCVVACLLFLGAGATASAAPIRVLGPGGRVRVVNDPWVSGQALTSQPAGTAAAGRVLAAERARDRAGAPTVPGRLSELLDARLITEAQERYALSVWDAALATERTLSGVPRAELEAVTIDVHEMALAGTLTAARLPEIVLTLERNTQWWRSGTLLAPDARVEFSGSPLLWEYYPGQGIQLQVLGTFGEADAMYTAGRYALLRRVLAQMIPLAVAQDGGITWDYLFDFDGGGPPWTSAMADGTALEALTRAYEATHERSYLTVAHDVLPVLATPAPRGLSVAGRYGLRFLQYSFAPRTDIINAFLQTLIGLYDYARVSGDPLARLLFASGDREAQALLPSFNTGAWSLYQPGVEDDLSYHLLVTGFLRELCARTSAPVYCSTARQFEQDLHTPPRLIQMTTRADAGQPFLLRFQLSKISRVGVVLLRGSRTLFETSAPFAYGIDSFWMPSLPAGSYTIHLAATDLAGNFARIVGSLYLTGPRPQRGDRERGPFRP
jgi:hypothetical protein